jgi:pimeloyl-ACP methyl ester carboxylesterase
MVRRVVLVHGLLISPLSMAWIGAQLSTRGWQTQYFAYSSLLDDPAHVSERLAQVLRDAGPDVAVVAHSLGGLVSLDALSSFPDLPVRRLVCMGTPLQGSSVVLALRRWPGGRYLVGRSAPTLSMGCTRWPEKIQVGMLAGSRPRSLGGVWARPSLPHDGTVSVAETRHVALTDHRVMDASHTGMLVDPAVVDRVQQFLDQGRFLP